MEEIWKDVVGAEGVYEVSNRGRVRCLIQGQGHRKRIMKLDTSTWGYHCVRILYNNGSYKYIGVHRLIAQAFLPIPKELLQYIGTRKLQVNHKDENKKNNTVENLEWCSASYNSKYGTISKRKLETAKKRNNPNSEKEVEQYDKTGNLINTWKSIHEAARQIGVTPGAICICCKGKAKTIKGFIFKYKQKS